MVDPAHVARQLQALLTEDDLRELQLCAEAEANVELDGALNHYLAAPHIEGAPQLADLMDLRGLGDEVPSWAWSRWILRQTQRWLLMEVDPRVREAVVASIPTVYADIGALHLHDPDEAFELGTRLAATNWVTEQLCLYDFDGLLDFLDLKAGPALLARADDTFAWASASMGGYRVLDLRADRLVVVDLVNGRELDALNLGAATSLDGATLIGRLVPIATSPGLMFESRPLEVDEQTAQEVARSAPMEWIFPLGDAVEEGRVREGIGFGRRPPLMSDVVPEPAWAFRDGGASTRSGRVRDLMDADLSVEVANAVAAMEMALVVAEVAPNGLPGCAPHAALVLVHRVVFEAAMEHCTSPRNERLWRQVAACVAEPARSRCLSLADACRGAAA